MICNPAIVTLVTSIITVTLHLSTTFSWMNLVLNIMLIPLWVVFLNFLCDKGYRFVAWGFAIMSVFSTLIAIIYEAFYLTTTTPVILTKTSASASLSVPDLGSYYPPDEESDGYESN
jgi:hypothetical protein